MTALEALRCVWISELQDRYIITTHKDMDTIIGHVDALLQFITEEEAAGLM